MTAPNVIWTADYKGQFRLGDGQYCFPLTVQDRVIRAEMRARLQSVLPADLRGRIDELNRDQFVALRFASDAEMADLVREVLTNKIVNRDDIKKRIKKWEPDDFRM